MRKFLLAAAFALFLPLGSSLAGPEAPPAPTHFRDVAADPFAKGSLSLENVTGLYYFFDHGDNGGATLDFAVNSLRLGVLLSDPHGTGFFAGNSEFLAEVFGGGIFQGAGDVLAGGTLIIRYNFFRPGARVIPYFQIGGGGVYPEGFQGIGQPAGGVQSPRRGRSAFSDQSPLVDPRRGRLPSYLECLDQAAERRGR